MAGFRRMAIVVAVGVTLGAAAAVVNNVPVFLGEVGEARVDRSAWSQAAEFFSLLLDSGWAWAAAAVAAGWLSSDGTRLFRAALAGGVALLVASTVYDSLKAWFGGDVMLSSVRSYWLIGSLILGPPLGMVGAAIRRPGLPGTCAALVVPFGAALNMVVVPPPADSPVARAVTVTVWGAAAAATVLITGRAIRIGCRTRRSRMPTGEDGRPPHANPTA
jgi:hypothetical protein